MGKLIASYLVLSFVLGLVMMLADALTSFRHEWMKKAVVVLYLPPLAVAAFGITVGIMYMIWMTD